MVIALTVVSAFDTLALIIQTLHSDARECKFRDGTILGQLIYVW